VDGDFVINCFTDFFIYKQRRNSSFDRGSILGQTLSCRKTWL